ncbi:MAG: hypothetical protein A2X08_00450 [Bacteroidetes bacterium GWA2_32_17]|nr:MAG: hypothetical protein A2X08_00450 [Bacteroidetes bacterium GWA2_32_17]
MKLFIVSLIIVILISGISNYAVSQRSIDSAITVPLFTSSFMTQFPGGDMAKRYGTNTNIGGSFMLKLKSNFIFELNANYIFGSKLRGDATHLFDSIETSDGEIINEYGEFAKLRTFERGFFVGARLGKVFPLCKRNPNSGILFMLGGGLLQHKIRIENDGNNVPQIKGDYKKGYDKMSYGFSSTEFIGYMFFSKSQLLNFYAGLEFYQGFTKSGRSYDYSLMKKDTQSRLDFLTSIKVGWVIPIYRRMPDEYYYY